MRGERDERILDKHLCRLLRTIEVATRHLRTGNPQLTCCAYWQTVACFVDDIKPDVVQRRANRNILHGLRHIERGDADGAFSGTVEVHQRVAGRGSEWSQLLTACQQIVQAVVLKGGGKLISHLRGHECVSNLLAFKIVVQCHQVQTQLFRDDVKRGTASECGIGLHHIGIEAIAGVGRHATVGRQVEPVVIPLAEGDDVAMYQLTAFGYARGARGVKHDEQRLRFGRTGCQVGV